MTSIHPLWIAITKLVAPSDSPSIAIEKLKIESHPLWIAIQRL